MIEPSKLKPRETVVELPLSVIWRDRTWNARSGNWEDDLDEIYESMQPEGPEGPIVQDSAVVVRPIESRLTLYGNPPENKPPEGCLFSLVSGFGRCDCRERVAKEREETNPTILAIVRNMTEGEALAANIRENVGRNELKVADAAWQLWNLYEHYGSIGEWKSVEELAPMIARKVDMTRLLLSIMKRGDKRVIQAWRNCRVVVSVADMCKVTAKPRSLQMEAFKALLNTPLGPKSNGRRWTSDKIIRSAESMGRLLGQLESAGLIILKLDFLRDIDKLVSLKEGGSFERRKAIAQAARAGYEQAKRLEVKPESKQEP